MRFTLLFLVLSLNTALGAWEGNWVGDGVAAIFGDGPYLCPQVRFTVTKTETGFTRTGTPQQCGKYPVIPKETQIAVTGDKVLLADGKTTIGTYTENRIAVDFVCTTCKPELSHIVEWAQMTGEDRYELYSAVFSDKGVKQLEYRYWLHREK